MKISLLYSGGVESTLLYYYLLNKENVSSLDLFIFDRPNQPIVKATALYEHLKKEWNDTVSTLTVLAPPDTKEHKINYVLNDLEKKYDYTYWGINAYPKNIVPTYRINTLSLLGRLAYKSRRKIKTPFMFKKKDTIIKQFYDNNIEDILPLTHSCGYSINGKPPCGTCFNCREREWAYKKLGIQLHRGI